MGASWKSLSVTTSTGSASSETVAMSKSLILALVLVLQSVGLFHGGCENKASQSIEIIGVRSPCQPNSRNWQLVRHGIAVQ